MNDENEAIALYQALLTRGLLHSASVRCLTYRCAEHKCALLDVVEVPGRGVIVGMPRHKTSPQETLRTSNEAGRAKNTEDGFGRWKMQASFREHVSRPALSCDHLRGLNLDDDQLDAHWAAGHADIRVRRDGTTFVVR